MAHSPQTSYFLIKLGQVDLEFIMYYKLNVKKELITFEKYCETSIDKYRKFIKKMLLFNKNIIIASINLPSYGDDSSIQAYIMRTISDNLVIPKINNESENVQILISPEEFVSSSDKKLSNFSLKQITENFMFFNNLLAELAKEMNLLFFDTTHLFINPDTKMLKDEYSGCGHHYKGFNDDASDAKKITHDYFYLFFKENVRK
jgi:hypothetical protein